MQQQLSDTTSAFASEREHQQQELEAAQQEAAQLRRQVQQLNGRLEEVQGLLGSARSAHQEKIAALEAEHKEEVKEMQVGRGGAA
jgi:predicted  nucleic acid-binding Zn-ribbon protein